MSNPTPYLPGFSHRLCGRRATSEATRLSTQAKTLDGLAALVARFIPAEVFAPTGDQRERIFPPWVTFIAFLGQVLTRGSVCREAVRRVQSWCIANRQSPPDENSSGYCQARKRLTLDSLRAAHEQISGWIQRHTGEAQCWCGRAVKVLDGCGV
ncbi:MAG: hypothetical protein IPL39_20040 [Opitutaceae bacterium]|nr:hypothetical protein [Opitutaceae bacterium]